MTNNYIPPQPWSTNPKFWDTVELAGKALPGTATVECERANKYDDKKSKGQHGGTREFNGADLAKVKIALRFITAEEHDSFVADHLPGLEPVPGKKKPEVVSISHAVTTARKVAQVTVDKIDGPKINNGMVFYYIDATEHREPEKKNATGTMKGVAPGRSCSQYLATYQKAQADLAQANEDLRSANEKLKAYQRQREAASTVLGFTNPDAKPPVSPGELDAQRDSVSAQQRIAQAGGLIASARAAMVANNCALPPSATAAGTGGGTWYSAELTSARGTAAGGVVNDKTGSGYLFDE